MNLCIERLQVEAHEEHTRMFITKMSKSCVLLLIIIQIGRPKSNM